MRDRALVIDTATGAIRRKISAPPEMLALNIGTEESLFVITGDDGMHIADEHLIVSEAGALVILEGAPEDITAPLYELQYVAL